MLQGYVGRSSTFSRVADPVEINAIRLAQGGRTAIIYSADVLFLNGDIGLRVEELVRRRLPRSETLVFGAATHTHCGPSVDSNKPRLGKPSPEYLLWFEDRCGSSMEALIADAGEPCRMRIRSCTAPYNVNRRRRGWRLSRRSLLRRATNIAPNPAGPKDDILRIVSIETAERRPIAVLWNFACHPAMFPLTDCVSADFPGVVRAAFRSLLGMPALPVVYLQGFSGDVLPTMLGKVRGFRQFALRALNGAVFGEISLAEYRRWSGALAQAACRCLENQQGEMVDPRLQFRSIGVPLHDLIDGGSEGSLSAQWLQLAENLHVVGVSAEVVAAYGLRLKELLPDSHVVPVGCVGSTFGYLPTRSMLSEGGYEVDEFFPHFSLQGRFKESLEDRVEEAFRQLLQRRTESP